MLIVMDSEIFNTCDYRYSFNDAKYVNIKYLKNFSTLGTNQYDDFKVEDRSKVYDPSQFDTTFSKLKFKTDVSPKVGQKASNDSFYRVR